MEKPHRAELSTISSLSLESMSGVENRKPFLVPSFGMNESPSLREILVTVVRRTPGPLSDSSPATVEVED